MAYKVIILYQLYMPSYFLGTFTEYPYGEKGRRRKKQEESYSLLLFFSYLCFLSIEFVSLVNYFAIFQDSLNSLIVRTIHITLL